MSGNNWYSEDCETFADYKFKQEQAHEKREQIIEDLLSALRVKRKAFMNGEISSDAWMIETQAIVQEADSHGVTLEVLEGLGES